MLEKVKKLIFKRDDQKITDLIDRLLEESKNKDATITRLSEVVNKQKEIISKFDLREYSFTPQSLTSEEQQIIGESIDSDLIKIITKWFKVKADQNNDLLIHNVDSSDERQSLWRLAVLMYEDWALFMRHCEQTFNSDIKTKKK